MDDKAVKFSDPESNHPPRSTPSRRKRHFSRLIRFAVTSDWKQLVTPCLVWLSVENQSRCPRKIYCESALLFKCSDLT